MDIARSLERLAEDMPSGVVRRLGQRHAWRIKFGSGVAPLRILWYRGSLQLTVGMHHSFDIEKLAESRATVVQLRDRAMAAAVATRAPGRVQSDGDDVLFVMAGMSRDALLAALSVAWAEHCELERLGKGFVCPVMGLEVVENHQELA